MKKLAVNQTFILTARLIAAEDLGNIVVEVGGSRGPRAEFAFPVLALATTDDLAAKHPPRPRAGEDPEDGAIQARLAEERAKGLGEPFTTQEIAQAVRKRLTKELALPGRATDVHDLSNVVVKVGNVRYGREVQLHVATIYEAAGLTDPDEDFPGKRPIPPRADGSQPWEKKAAAPPPPVRQTTPGA